MTLETETFVQTTEYDALNRPTSITMPDSSEILPIYNEAGLLESVTAHVRGATGLTTFVDDIDYDAKGQREKIVYGNGVYTEYEYDEFTFRVKRIKTTRDSDDEVLQDLRYTYDAVGNIVEMADLAHETFYHGGHEIKAVWKYEYDALYRLTYGTGREHVGTNDDIQQDENGFPLVNGANPNDPSAMRNYEEWFEYDQVGNIVKMIHDAQSSVGDWTRHYHIAETSNRLLDTSLPGDDEEDEEYSGLYEHDEHGNMKKMPHLPDGIEWDFKDQMRHVDKGGGGDVYFVYDASGQRIRKVWEHSGIVEERIYLGGFELYRRHELGDVVLERETLHIMDDAQRIAMIETKTIDEAADPFTITPRIRYQLGNHLGSAMLELDHEGLVISYEEYHPYGTSAYRAVDDSIEVSAKRYRYTGKERDEETGLYYHGARYYACWLGRWTAADPTGMVDGVNLFQYVRGRPIGSSDPSGMEGEGGANNRWSGLNVFVGKVDNSEPVAREPAPIRIGVTTVEHVRPIRGHETPEGASAPNNPYFVVDGQEWDARDFRPSSDVGIIEGVTRAWNQGDTSDRAELVATGVGTAGGTIPYAGDYVSFYASVFVFGVKPSWSAAGDVGLDAVGAILPFVPALGTLRRVDALADGANIARKADAANAGYRGLRPGDPLPDDEILVMANNAPGNFKLRPDVDSMPIGDVTTPGKSATIANDLTLETEIPQMFGRGVKPGDILSGGFVSDIRAAGFDVVYAPTVKNSRHVRIVAAANGFDENGVQWLNVATDRIGKAGNR